MFDFGSFGVNILAELRPTRRIACVAEANDFKTSRRVKIWRPGIDWKERGAVSVIEVQTRSSSEPVVGPQ